MKTTRFLLALLALPALLGACRTVEFSEVQKCLSGQALQQPLPARSSHYTGEILVGYQPAPQTASPAVQSGLRQLQSLGVQASHGLELLEARGGLLPDLMRATGDPLAAARQLEADPRVAYAVADFSLQLLEVPDCHDQQWNLSDFGVPSAWGRGPGRHQVVVAVVDSGIDVDHPELAAAMLPGFNFRDMTEDPRPVLEADRHGTHVAGIIAARGLDATAGAAGVAGFPDHVKVLPIRIFNDNATTASFDDLVLAIAWAAGESVPGAPANRHPADVINLSLGANLPPQPGVDEAISRIVDRRGITVVAASGNDLSGTGDIGIYAPANSAAALAVGSVDSDSRLSYFSVYGGPTGIVVTAPGGSGPSSCGYVFSTVPFGGYGCEAGTSMAAPFVSGAVALLLTHEPQLTPAGIEARLRAATHFDPEFMTGEAYGAGVLCVNRLLAGAREPSSSGCD